MRLALPDLVVPPGHPAHVIVIGIDGLTARALGKGNTPTLDRMMAEGASTLTAKAVAPTMSSPNWASHFMGAGPRQHGIQSNDWRPTDWAGESWFGKNFCGLGLSSGWPTIFEVLKDAAPGARASLVYDWVGIGRFVPRRATDRRRFVLRSDLATWFTRRQIRLRQPRLLFVQLDTVDGAGHTHGFDSWQYHRELWVTDGRVARILTAIGRAGIMADTLVMVVSDHGGIGRFHGGLTPEEIQVPWILWGKGVFPAKNLPDGISVKDTAPTIAHALALDQPTCWTGRAVTEAFTFP